MIQPSGFIHPLFIHPLPPIVGFTGSMPPVLATSPENPAEGSATHPWKDLKDGSALLRDKRVVIVEDEGLTQIHLRKICLLAGMQVVGAAVDGEQGVQQVLQKHPDIVLMDIKIPLLNGLEAAERILKEFSVCVVMLTAYDIEDYKAQAQALGTGGYVFKPVNASSLIPQLEAAYAEYQRKHAPEA